MLYRSTELLSLSSSFQNIIRMGSIFLITVVITSILTVYAAHNCQQYGCSQSSELANSGASYLELYSQTPSGITFNFDVTLAGNGQFTLILVLALLILAELVLYILVINQPILVTGQLI